MIRNVCLAVSLAVVLVLIGLAADMPRVGQMAPAVSLPSQDGSMVNLRSFRGKWVVLYFYPKDMTSGCTLEAHNFQQDLDKYNRLSTVILGVSVDSADSHKQFCTQQSLTFRLLSDTAKAVTEQYGVLGANGVANRVTFLINPEGQVTYVWNHVDPRRHSDEVLAALTTQQQAAMGIRR